MTPGLLSMLDRASKQRTYEKRFTTFFSVRFFTDFYF